MEHGADPLVPQELLGRAVGEDPAALEKDHPVREGEERVELVLDDQHGRPLGPESLEDAEEPLRPLLVELGGRLVQDQDRRPEREGRGDRDPLLLAAREGVRRPIAEIGRRGHLEDPLHLREQRLPREGEPLEARGELLLDGREDQLGVRVVEDDADVPADLGEPVVLGDVAPHQRDPARGRSAVVVVEDAGGREAERGLARARGTGHEHDLPLLHAEGDVVEGPLGAGGVGVRVVLELDHVLSGSGRRTGRSRRTARAAGM